MSFEDDVGQIEEYGAELRNDWSDFDGRSALSRLSEMAKNIRNSGVDKQKVREALNKLIESIDYYDGEEDVFNIFKKELGL